MKLRIAELRNERDITQTELSKAIGVAQSVVSNWENETNEPKASYLVLLANYFDVSIDYICNRKDY